MNNYKTKLEKVFSSMTEEDGEITLKILSNVLDIKRKWEGRHVFSENELGTLARMSFLTNETFGQYIKGLYVEGENGNFIIDKADFGVGMELRQSGSYGRFELDCLKEYVDENTDILVVGAHIGTLAIPLAKMCASVVAIEANKMTYALLVKNILLNNIENCIAYNIAASDVTGQISFLENTSNSGGSKRKPIHHEYMYYYDNPTETLVNAEPLDSYLENHNFDVILMDLEGSEYFALKGMQRLIRNLKVLIIEFVPHHFKNVSGVTIDDLLKLLPSFDRLTIPSRGIIVDSKSFSMVLNYMYENNISDEGIIFERSKHQ
jgi:FkbM family methyltransferase